MPEQYLGLMAFLTPGVLITFAIAWCLSLLFPRPRANWRHGIAAFAAAWIGTTILAPSLSRSPIDFMDNGPIYIVPFVISAAVLLLLPRLTWKVAD